MADRDPLVLLRQSISASQTFTPVASADASSPAVELAQATHLAFPDQSAALPINAPTRFVSNDKAVDLRSIYFAWLNRERPIPEYNAAATELNDSLAAAESGGKVHNLGFIEKLDLITWLEGASEESEYIKPLAGDKDDAAADGAQGGMTATGAVKKASGVGASSAGQARSGKGTIDPRLASVYNGERRMGDRNTVLRGVKPTDFSHVRKLALPFLSRKPQTALVSSAQIALNQKTPNGRRPDPIILLSPSASALLRLSNARSFLEDGKFTPPDTGSGSTASMLHVQRIMPLIDPSRPLRFILVEGPEQFKPEYWNRVAGVFTTGQTWQFKNYRWSNPNELFKHTLGIYIGWRGEAPPDNVKGWGHRVLSTGIDRWRGEGQDASRFRDKEVIEQIWKAIEMSMSSKGWRKDAAPTSI